MIALAVCLRPHDLQFNSSYSLPPHSNNSFCNNNSCKRPLNFHSIIEMGKKRVLVGYGVDIDAGELFEPCSSIEVDIR
jgi:hypothetical protein